VIEAGCLRVTHPSATIPEGTVRLACIRHAASVRPEPGSNSPLVMLVCFPCTKTCLAFLLLKFLGFLKLALFSFQRAVVFLF
jgi:hypothetical protein